MDKPLNIKFRSVDEYLLSMPMEKRKNLEELRTAVRQTVPDAEEGISYNMPAFRFHGILLYYAAHKEHIGFYPGNSKLILKLNEELKDFETSKGTIKFPFNKTLPVALIKKIAKIRAVENLEKRNAKKPSKS
jgi:uncharacterized protein YdhG (YjbR/CyaY superfamily)